MYKGFEMGKKLKKLRQSEWSLEWLGRASKLEEQLIADKDKACFHQDLSFSSLILLYFLICVLGGSWASLGPTQLPWASCSPICLAGSAKATSFCSPFQVFLRVIYSASSALTDEGLLLVWTKEQACLLFVIKTMDFPNSEFSTMMQTYVCSITHVPTTPPPRTWEQG